MTLTKIFLLLAPFVYGLTNNLHAQQTINANEPRNMQTEQQLSTKQQAIVTIAAFTAQGNMKQLQVALDNGLNAGLSISEIKEILVQLYAYAGFPRSLNALQNFMAVLKERQQKGIKDEPGKAPDPLPADKTKLQLGTEIQTKLVGRPVKGEIYEFAPAIDQFLKEHLFGDIFGRGILDFKTREIATISALAGLGGAEGQLRSHFGVGMYNGLTAGQLNHLVSIIQSNVGSKEGNAANEVLQTVLKQRQENGSTAKNTFSTPENNAIFPKGEKASPDYFTGTAWVNILVPKDETRTYSIGNVVFEPGCRNNWHIHPAGQILIVTDGKGWYQEKGKLARGIGKGDVVIIPAGVEHWHGATKDSALTHLAVTNSAKEGAVKWLQQVTDEEYNKLGSQTN